MDECVSASLADPIPNNLHAKPVSVKYIFGLLIYRFPKLL
jgi:hypothetical protein